MVELFKSGGPLMYALLVAALVGIAVIFERMVVLHRMPSAQKAEKQLTDVEASLTEGGLVGCAQKVQRVKVYSITFSLVC